MPLNTLNLRHKLILALRARHLHGIVVYVAAVQSGSNVSLWRQVPRQTVKSHVVTLMMRGLEPTLSVSGRCNALYEHSSWVQCIFSSAHKLFTGRLIASKVSSTPSLIASALVVPFNCSFVGGGSSKPSSVTDP